MNKHNKQSNKGFTIIEALVAIFILTVSVISMLSVTASSATSARYANNEIAAKYLSEEAIDYIRNSRDTIAFQHKDDNGYGWNGFINKYNNGTINCFSPNGCDIRMEKFDPSSLANLDLISCGISGCENLYFDKETTSKKFFYSHDDKSGSKSPFSRTIKMENIGSGGDQIKVTVAVNWKNGSIDRTQSIIVYLLNWQK